MEGCASAVFVDSLSGFGIFRDDESITFCVPGKIPSWILGLSADKTIFTKLTDCCLQNNQHSETAGDHFDQTVSVSEISQN